MAVNVPSWLGNTPYARDSLLPRTIVSMLTSFALNAGVAELKPAALLYKVFPAVMFVCLRAGYLTPDHCPVTLGIALHSVKRGGLQ